MFYRDGSPSYDLEIFRAEQAYTLMDRCHSAASGVLVRIVREREGQAFEVRQ